MSLIRIPIMFWVLPNDWSSRQEVTHGGQEPAAYRSLNVSPHELRCALAARWLILSNSSFARRGTTHALAARLSDWLARTNDYK